MSDEVADAMSVVDNDRDKKHLPTTTTAHGCTAILQAPRVAHMPVPCSDGSIGPNGQLMQAGRGGGATARPRPLRAVSSMADRERCGCLAGLVSCSYRISDANDRPSDSFVKSISACIGGMQLR